MQIETATTDTALRLAKIAAESIHTASEAVGGLTDKINMPAIVNTAETVLQKFSDSVGTILSTYGQPTADLVLNVARITALQELIPGIIILIIFVYAFRVSMVSISQVFEKKEEGIIIFVKDLIVSVIAGSSTLISMALSFGHFTALTNVFNWAGLFFPEVYLAHKLLERVL